MKKFLLKYMWLFEMIACALLIGLGITLKFVPGVLLILVGLVFLVLGVLRIIPLVKTTDDKVLKIIYASELGLDIIAGLVLLVFGINKDVETIDNMKNVFGYIIASILYIRGFVYLFSTSVRKDTANLFIFLAHIGLLTLASIIFARGGFSLATLGYILLALAVISSIFIAFDAVKKYNNYRGEEYAIKKTKKIKETEKTLESPTADEIKNENIITEKEEDHRELNA